MAAEPAQPPEVYSAIRTKRAMSKPVAPTNNPTWPPYAPTISILVSALLATGKTYLAVACAVESLLKDDVERILLVRPPLKPGKNSAFYPVIYRKSGPPPAPPLRRPSMKCSALKWSVS